MLYEGIVSNDKKKLPHTQVWGSEIFHFYLYFDRSRDHILEDDLKRHGMPTTLVGDKELAIALEFAVIKLYFMIVIFTVESQIERIKAEAIMFLGITFGLLYLSDHSRIHLSVSFRK